MKAVDLLRAIGLVTLVLCGCARNPAMPVAVEPSAAPLATADGGPNSRSTGGERMATTSGRPALGGFVSVSDLPDIHFDFDRYTIRPDDARILDGHARWLKVNARDLLLIEGHSDERGTNEYNIALGDRRATAAVNYLVAHGIDARRITMVSYGKERPQCSDHSEACWATNRRAHFLVKHE